MTEHAPAISARRLSKHFAARAVLDAIDLDIAAGQSVALTGANGAGKTTLLRCLASLVRPSDGEVRWFGESSADPAARRLIGMVAHETRLYPHLTLRENLVFAARMHDVAGPRRAPTRCSQPSAWRRTPIGCRRRFRGECGSGGPSPGR